MSSASAAGKAILMGEHAVVYGRPAIAVPVSQVRAVAEVVPGPVGAGIVIVAEDLGETYRLDQEATSDVASLPARHTAHALQTTVRNTLQHLGVDATGQDLRITLRSQVPIARGLGSGTAVATALVRALAAHYGVALEAQAISALVYRTEVILHGTPSGVDNTVVAFERPVYFQRGHDGGAPRIEPLTVGRPLRLLIGDTGIPSRTRDAVEAVRRGWQAAPARYVALFDQIAALVEEGRQALAAGEVARLGEALSANQALLQELDVSNAALDALVGAAQAGGAWGCKLSGGGRGGCMIALVDEAAQEGVAARLRVAGARAVLSTVIEHAHRD
jgi:mevalonate kinase